MTDFDYLPLLSLLALLPIALRAWKGMPAPDGLFWLLLAVGAIGPVTLLARSFHHAWSGNLATTLWVSIAVVIILFAGLSALRREACRLSGLLFPYLILLAILAIASGGFGEAPRDTVSPIWFASHLVLAGLCYGALSLGAIAGIAVLLQERALKSRQPENWAGRNLPALAEAEALQIGLLILSAGLLAASILSGTALEILAGRPWLPFTHKIVFTILSFVSVVFLLILHQRTGLRGRQAARWVLVGYLLLTLAYPGVKFVQDVLIGQ